MGRRSNGEGSIYQRGSDGRWVGSFTDQAGRRRVVYGRTQREVLGKLRAMDAATAKANTGGDAEPRDLPLAEAVAPAPTLGEYLRTWVATSLPERVVLDRLKQSTADSYADIVAIHIAPQLGGEPLNVRPARIRQWLADLSVTPRLPKCRACGLLRRAGVPDRCDIHQDTDNPLWPRISPRTVAYCHAVLRAALSEAVDNELISRNPATLVSPPSAGRSRVKPLGGQELAALLSTSHGTRLEALWITMLGTGMRRGEALALHWPDIDLAGRSLHVDTSLQRLRGLDGAPSGLFEVTPKTPDSVADIALPAIVVEALRQHQERQLGERALADWWGDPSLVFSTPVGTYLEPRNVTRAWQALCADADIRHVRLHDLRHTAATVLLLQGVEMKVVQNLLRHSRLATTADIYTHVTRELEHVAADRMDHYLNSIHN